MNIHERIETLRRQHEALLTRKNEPVTADGTTFGTFRFAENGIYEKYRYPVLTAEHIPLESLWSGNMTSARRITPT